MKKSHPTGRAFFAYSVLDALSDPICVVDETGTIDYVNQAWRSFAIIHGTGAKPVAERSNYFGICEAAPDVTVEQTRQFIEGIQAVLRGERGEFSFEYPHRSLSEKHWFLVKVTPLHQGDQVQAVIAHRDITAFRQTRETLRERADLLETVLVQAADGIVVCDAQGNQILINRAAQHLAHQHSKDRKPDAVQLTWGKAYYPDGSPVPLEQWALMKALRGETTIGGEARMVRPDGTDYEVLISAAPLINAREEIIGAVATFSDITSRREMEKALQESEAQLRLALDSGHMGTWVWEPHSNRVTWDSRECELLGVEPMTGSANLEQFFDLVHPQDRDRLRRSLAGLLANQGRWDEEFRIVLSDGQVRWLAGRGDFKRESADQPPRVVGIDFDITERKQAERALVYERELFQRIIDAVPVMIVIYDGNLQAIRLNPECERVLGWTSEEARQMDWLATCYPNSHYRNQVVQDMLSPALGWRDFQVMAKDGTVVDSSWANIRLNDNTLIGIGFDNRERRQAEKALRRAHERIQSILESIRDGFISLDRRWQFTYVNRTAARLLRHRPEELMGEKLWEVFSPALGTAFEGGFRHAMEEQVFVLFEAYYPPLNAWFECHCYPSADGLSVFFSDTTERKRVEHALQQSEARLRAIVKAVPDVLLVLDKDGRYLEIITDRPHLLYTEPAALQGKLVTEVLPAEAAERVLGAIDRALRTRRTQIIEYDLPISRVGKRYYEVSIAPLGIPMSDKPSVVVLARDITQHRLTEDNRRQLQKMEAIGQLTGGVAHDFNNLLAIILGNLELLGEGLQERSDLQDLLRRSLQAAERGTVLIQYLLTFSRRQPLQPKSVDVNALVLGMLDKLRRTMDQAIEVKTVLAEDLDQTVIDPDQLETALLNLVQNAREAMPEGGCLTLGTANVWLGEDYTALHQDIRPGRYVLVTVEDTGVGMTPQVLEHAVEPFFTTKETGQGSGLGLSMVYGLVRRSDGHMVLDSEMGRGTGIRLYLPAAEAQTHAHRATHNQSSPLPRGQSETILVVESDPSERQLTVHRLQNLDYQTLEAATEDEALVLLETTPQVVLLLIDLLPTEGKPGADLAFQAWKRWPDLKILFTSGYAEHSLSGCDHLPRNIEVLRKPYRQSQLAIRLRVMLEQRKANPDLQ